jgi:hypothetical protein
MIRKLDRLARLLPGLLAVPIVCLLPTLVQAETVIFRNECRSSIVVQTSTVVKGMVQRDQPNLLRPGEYSPKINFESDKIVTVYDARTNRVLFRDVLKYTKMDLGYSIQPDPKVPNKVLLHFRKPMNGGMMKGK